MKLSIIIPCYNEIDTIERIVQKVKELSIKKEIIIVDDCSTDGTREKLRNTIELKVDKVIYHKRNSGKGSAVRTGLKNVEGDIVIIQDADLEYDPKDIPKLIQPILDDNADVVYGSRFAGNEPHRVLFFWHMIGNKFLTFISNMFTNLNLTDIEVCYKAFKREIIQSIAINENRFGFEVEITAKLARMQCRMFEIGVSYYGRTYKEGKKISWRDGLSALGCIIKYNLFRRNKL